MFWWKHLELIKGKVDNVEDKMERLYRENNVHLQAIERVLIKQEENLKTHMARSEHLEEIVEEMRNSELAPLKRHVNMVEGALKLLGVLGLLVSMAAGIAKVLGAF